MSSWTRTTSFDCVTDRQVERWNYAPPGAKPQEFRVAVSIGKPLDVIGLKNTTLKDITDHAGFLSQTAAARLYNPNARRRSISLCPCCCADVMNASVVLTVFKVDYRRCGDCGHVFVGEQPEVTAMNSEFADSEELSQVYHDPATTELRLQQVAAPKAAWALDNYLKHHGRKARSCIDVGAGGGHFVATMLRQGLGAVGFELSASSRSFAKSAFDIDLRPDDFLGATVEPADIVCMFGLLEYTPEPRKILAAARKWFGEEGLLVVEVPRFDALGTVAQAANPSNIARHMDPTSHLNCFSDSSLATALVEEGFRPVAAWYFGMDAYEMFVQTALRLGDDSVIARLADMIPAVQAACDAGRQCDDIIVAAVPV